MSLEKISKKNLKKAIIVLLNSAMITGMTSLAMSQAAYADDSSSAISFDQSITGKADSDVIYKDYIDESGKYSFNKDVSIKTSNEKSIDIQKPLQIDADNHSITLTRNNNSGWGDPIGSINQSVGGTSVIKAGNIYINGTNKASFEDKAGITVTGKSEKAVLQLDSNVNMNISVGSFSTGLGVKAKGNADVIINGDFSVKSNDNSWGLTAGSDPMALKAVYALGDTNEQKASTIKINGSVDINTQGDGLVAESIGSSIYVQGGSIKTDKNSSKAYYALEALSGNASINMDEDGHSSDSIVNIWGNAGALTDGASYSDPITRSLVQIGLVGKESSWHGIAFEQGKQSSISTGNAYYGEIYLALENGASWSNEQYGTVNSGFKGSSVSKLTGESGSGAYGIIYQNDQNPLNIAKYSGKTYLVYNHSGNGSKSDDYTGGNTFIQSADPNAEIVIVTDNQGINTSDEDNLTSVLNALASKLYYQGAIGDKEKNLTGKAEISEGLTAPSKSLVIRPITFDNKTGAGLYKKIDSDNPGGKDQDKTEFNQVIDGTHNEIYTNAGVQSSNNTTYHFTKDSTVKINQRTLTVPDPDWEGSYLDSGSAIQAAGTTSNLTIDASNHVLTLNVETDADTVPPVSTPGILHNRIPLRGISNMTNGGNVQVNAKKLLINVENNYTNPDNEFLMSPGEAVGIYAKGDNKVAAVDVTGDVDMKVHGSYTAMGLRAVDYGQIDIHGDFSLKGDTQNYGIWAEKTPAGESAWMTAAGMIARGDHATITVDGKTGITANGASGIAATHGGTVNIHGADVAIKDNSGSGGYYHYSAIASLGKININVDQEGASAGSETVSLVGNVGVTADAAGQAYSGPIKVSEVNIGLNNKNSTWTGVGVNSITDANAGYEGNINLFLANGAVWTNHKYGDTLGDYHYDGDNTYSFAGSHIHKLSGGIDSESAGIILQDNDKDINVDNYSGNTLILYKHDETDPTKMIGGDFRIANAADSSAVTLMTDNKGGLTKDSKNLDDVLNHLAQKLYYTANDGHLTGTVKIADGLTSSSEVIKMGKISFSTSDTGTKTAGQGYYADESAANSQIITGDEKSDTTYVDSGIFKNGVYTFTKDTTLSRDKAGYLVNRKKDFTIDAAGHTLTLQASGGQDGALPAAIYINDGSAVVNAKKLDITIHNTAQDGYWASGIQLGTMGGGQKSALTINGDLSISSSSHGADFGIYALENSSLTVNGNVAMKGSDGSWGVTTGDILNGNLAHYHANGIYAGFGPASVHVTGDVDLAVDGTAVQSNGGASIVIDGGGTILTNKEAASDQYALESEAGTVKMNVITDGSGNIKEAGKNTVKISGNLGVLNKSSGASPNEDNAKTTVQLGLHGQESLLDGAAFNEFAEQGKDGGSIDLALDHGAVWNNETYGKVKSSFTGSRIRNLHGGSAGTEGYIYQNDTRDIRVDNYSGNTVVIYKHDETDPTKMIGGDFRIANAAKGSAITLLTDNKGGLTKDSQNLDEVLNKLAQKLYYTGYADGNLSGTVKIAEGLTASSAEVKSGVISFSDGTTGTKTAGQGFYEAPVIPESQTDTEFTDTITGVKANDKKYVDTGVLKDEGQHYIFTKDTTITAANTINVGAVDHAVDINAKGHTLTLDSETTGTGTTSALAANSLNGVTITADKLVIKASDKGRMEAINVGGQGQQNKDTPNKLTINGDVDMQVNGNNYALGLYAAGNSEVTFNGNISAMGDANNTWGLTSEKGAWGYYGVSLVYSGSNYALQMGPKVTINGDVNAKIDGNCLFANGGHAKLTINGGGNIEINKDNTHHYYAMIAESGTTSMNVNLDDNYNATGARTNKLVLKGNITASTGAVNANEPELHSVVNLGLATKDSEWTGVAYNKFPEAGKVTGGKTFTGAINLFLQNGAAWNNEEWGAVETSAWGAAAYTGSHLTKLVGGDSAANAGVINQNDANDIRVDNYSGNTVVVYKHDETDPTKMIGGDFRITNAAEGSGITLLTDSKGLTAGFKDSDSDADKILVANVMEKLANKLYYTSYADGHLTGYVKIADGLTASSKSMKLGAIGFSNGTTGTGTEGQGYYDSTKKVTDPDNPDTPDKPTNPDTPDTPDTPSSSLDIEYGSEETQMMKGTKSALLGSAMMWRSNNNDIQRRMGDLRLGQGETGVWARYMGGKNKFDQQNTYLNQDYDIGQAGFDKKVGDWTVGFALDHGDGKSHYIGGKGKEKMNTLAIYGTRVSNDGKYFDVIVKTGQVKNKFDVSNEIGNKLHGDYKAWGNSISLEYGKRFVQDSGFYMDPSVEFTAGRLNGKNFKGTSDLGTLYVHQHGFNSAIGRVGFSIGRQLPKSNLYAKFALAHEFAGNFKTDFYADDGGLKSTKVDLGDTWLDMELGGSLSLGKNVYLYGTYTRTFEADMATKWRADVGVRYTF